MAASRSTGLQHYEGLRVSREQYLGLPDDGHKYDMIDGVLHMSPSATPERRSIQLLVSQSGEWKHKTGNVLESELLSGFQINVERFFN